MFYDSLLENKGCTEKERGKLMEHIIEVQSATKRINDKVLLDDVNLQVKKGEIIGIIGRNGSGKTVLFKCICGFMKLDTGKILVNDREIGKNCNMPKDTGIIIESPGFLPAYSGYRNLLFLANIKGKTKREKICEAMKQVGLEPENKKAVKTYSMGMKQRLAIAQAIMEDQNILILDEPMNGLDDGGVEDTRRLLLKLREQGKTILIASHMKEDIDVLCDKVFRMEKGKMSIVQTAE